MQLFELPRADAIPFAERAVKARVIPKAAGVPHLRSRHALEQQLFRGKQAHLDDILVIRNPHVLLEHMGNAELVGVKDLRNRFERQVPAKVV